MAQKQWGPAREFTFTSLPASKRVPLTVSLLGCHCRVLNVFVFRILAWSSNEKWEQSLQQVRMSWTESDGIAFKRTILSLWEEGREREHSGFSKLSAAGRGEGYNAGGKTKNRGLCYKGKSGAGGQDKLEHAENVLH